MQPRELDVLERVLWDLYREWLATLRRASLVAPSVVRNIRVNERAVPISDRPP